MTRMYTKETLDDLDEDIEYYKEKSVELQRSCWHKDNYSNYADRNVLRLKKLRKLLELNLEVETFGQPNFGMVLVNRKFVVCLLDNNWRVVNKNVWYRHKDDLNHFVETYIKGDNNEDNT